MRSFEEFAIRYSFFKKACKDDSYLVLYAFTYYFLPVLPIWVLDPAANSSRIP